MKNITFIVILFGLLSTSSIAQSIKTEYVRGKNSSFCGDEQYYFTFDSRGFEKIDYYSGEKNFGPSKITQTNYDDSGYYFEIRTPHYILDEKGIGEYRRFQHFSHKILYDKRGGDILYVYEINMDLNGNDGKFYFTEDGYEIFCK